MAKPGDTLTHPLTGERIVWRTVARDTQGAQLTADLYAEPGAAPAARHVHPVQEERFLVVQGVVRLEADGVTSELEPGEVGVVPAGTPHTWQSVGDVEAQVTVDFLPALRSEIFFETFFGLAADGKTNAKGLPHLLQMAVILREYAEEMRLASPPAGVQRVVFTPLAALGRALGYRGWYPRYSPDPLPRPAR